jgi:hypothetical protein
LPTEISAFMNSSSGASLGACKHTPNMTKPQIF